MRLHMQLLIGLSSLLLVGCGTQLRSPLCTQPLSSLPAQFQGTYQAVLPTQSAAQSNNSVLKTQTIVIDAGTVAASQEVQAGLNWAEICSLQMGATTRYFMSQMNSNGTYSITEMQSYAGGIIFTSYGLDQDAAKANGFSVYYLPSIPSNMNVPTVNGAPGVGSLFAGSFILDNRNLTLQQILSVTKPIAMRFNLQSVSAQKMKTRKVWFDVTKSGIKRRLVQKKP